MLTKRLLDILILNHISHIMDAFKVKKYASYEQMVLLVTLMEQNLELARNRFSTAQGRLKQNEQWKTVALKLNSVAGGAIKDVEKWKQSWRDIKTTTKKKASGARRSLNRTGGGPSDDGNSILTELDERVIAIVGKECITGIASVPDTPSPIMIEIQNSVPVPNVTASPVTLEIESPEPCNASQLQSSIITQTPKKARSKINPRKRMLSGGNAYDIIQIEQEKLKIKQRLVQIREEELVEKRRKNAALERIAAAYECLKNKNVEEY